MEAYDQRQRDGLEAYDQRQRDGLEAYDQRQRDGIELAEENPGIIGAGAIGPHVVTNPAVGTTVIQIAHGAQREEQRNQRNNVRRQVRNDCQSYSSTRCDAH